IETALSSFLGRVRSCKSIGQPGGGRSDWGSGGGRSDLIVDDGGESVMLHCGESGEATWREIR
ncbi:hypothetical protein A2U01_0071728, partial [Trifolium medium]|nr:hypothetical protein [Trifolium medium]